MLAAFCEKCYSKSFDGAATLAPMVCPQSDMSILPLFFLMDMVGGFLPIRVALPCLISILSGPSVTISPQILCEAF